MKKEKFKIGWQKYEDLIEKQLSSPILLNVIKNFMMQNIEIDESINDEDIEDDEDYSTNKELDGVPPSIVPISPQLIEELTMLSNFECWMAHTNFDITPSIKEKLNNIPGIEVLKICSRYRFFIGIGNMFDFSKVRVDIENGILPKGD